MKFQRKGKKLLILTILASVDWDDKPYKFIYEKVIDFFDDLAALFFG